MIGPRFESEKGESCQTYIYMYTALTQYANQDVDLPGCLAVKLPRYKLGKAEGVSEETTIIAHDMCLITIEKARTA